MPKRKVASSHIEKANKRMSGLKSIDDKLDLGNGLTVDTYDASIAVAIAKEAAYNQLLSTLDTTYNEYKVAEKNLRDINERMLMGVAAKFGKDSNEYEQAGGIKKSERKRPVRKTSKLIPETSTQEAKKAA
jgi:hypothetical protein